MMTQKGKMIAPSQKEISKSTEDYDKHRFEVYRNNMLGLDEMLKKKLWTIADPPKTESKEKIKAIVLIGQYLERDILQFIRNELCPSESVKHI
jgi:hypothetical protein